MMQIVEKDFRMFMDNKAIFLIITTLLFTFCGLGAGDELNLLHNETRDRYGSEYEAAVFLFWIFGAVAATILAAIGVASSDVKLSEFSGQTSLVCVAAGFSAGISYVVWVGPFWSDFFTYWIIILITGLTPISIFTYHQLPDELQIFTAETSDS
jgi:hypothetical protein